jgi:hypothetical protein
MPRFAPALAVVLVAACAAPAYAKVPRTAKISSLRGSGQVFAYGSAAPEGAPLVGKTLKHRQVYEFRGVSAKIRFAGNTFKARPGTIVLLTTYAAAKGEPQRAALGLMTGRLDVTTRRSAPGGVTNEEGLFNPPVKIAMRYRVERKLSSTDPVGPGDIGAFYANVASQRTGTTTITTLDGKPVNVTPYVGASPGTCRHADKAVLRTTSTYGHGTAKYVLG